MVDLRQNLKQHFKRWQNVLMAFVCVLLLFMNIVNTPVTTLSIVDVSVADGNGTLSLGAWGYCLYLRPNRYCRKFWFLIGQFFLQP